MLEPRQEGGPAPPVPVGRWPLASRAAAALPPAAVADEGATRPAGGPGGRQWVSAETAPRTPRISSEHWLMEAVERARRVPGRRMAVVLHLSRLAAPMPRPHHQRIAQALMQDAADRLGGQVFALRNKDLVMIGEPAGEGRAVRVSGPVVASLPETLARLVRIDMPDPEQAVAVWFLPADLPALAAFAAARLAEAAEAEPLAPAAVPPLLASALQDAATLVGSAHLQNVLRRQTGAILELQPGGRTELRPAWREIALADASVDAASGGLAESRDGGLADPFLRRYLTARLDERLLAVLPAEIGLAGALDGTLERSLPPALAGRPGARPRRVPPLHLNLTLGGVLAPAFDRLVQALRAESATFCVEISLIEACADPKAFYTVRARLRADRIRLVLDDVSHLACLIAAPMLLDADLLKLTWSPRIADLPARERALLVADIGAFGGDRIILDQCDGEAAVLWGMRHGIARFQGKHVDAMLAASRMTGCVFSEGCTLRQCMERATATGPAGRAGCRDPGLLDAGAPPSRLGGGQTAPADRSVAA